ncbi:MAG TPA: pyridoxal phosphate-dependent aminotransferase [Syntrophales bacterium]|jgi:aspartate aminotransferase|nr:pyridoxal phosphate-dependent aminotransferase [Syntrophales bacterium]HON22607.1 pyridoxal phosphate-dependent aminotransferase [Syntrophales bacterium]HOU77101.1 pyridoxal phosphate-dependent aminotransferase [Syntrophales bacterium]HPC32781.1 pyridoxal phosphate-dependent aminotransferase [Syntrophales bacterium]HQG33629.1 pyridoxal phosphate-dependent aminotransferase [Syntrophales bacterium]
MKLAQRIHNIKPSPTLAITMKANALRAAGRDIIGFGAGEPDFDTPENIKAAAVKAIAAGFTKYTPVGGIDELKDAVAAKMARDHGLTYNRAQIVVSCGAKHTLYNLVQVLCEEGDEVIVPAPYWVSYADIVVLAGATPVIVNTEESGGFKLTPGMLRRAITDKTRVLILNSPSNPTGAAYNREELQDLAEVLAATEITVISDDIYEKIVYDGFEFFSIAAVSEAMKRRTVVVNGVSKAYAMTGWRIGYAAGSEEIIAAVNKLQSQNTSNPTSIAQKAAVEALNGDQEPVAMMVRAFQKRRDVIVPALNKIPGISCPTPQGAFYVFPNVARIYGRSYQGKVIGDSTALAAYLLEEANVAVVPGADFGADDYIRLSYATSLPLIEAGIERIDKALRRLD